MVNLKNEGTPHGAKFGETVATLPADAAAVIDGFNKPSRRFNEGDLLEFDADTIAWSKVRKSNDPTSEDYAKEKTTRDGKPIWQAFIKVQVTSPNGQKAVHEVNLTNDILSLCKNQVLGDLATVYDASDNLTDKVTKFAAKARTNSFAVAGIVKEEIERQGYAPFTIGRYVLKIK